MIQQDKPGMTLFRQSMCTEKLIHRVRMMPVSFEASLNQQISLTGY